MGTNLATQHLTSQHFGGEQFNGCKRLPVGDLSPGCGKKYTAASWIRVWTLSKPIPSAPTARPWLEFGLQEQTGAINLAAARLARRLADEYARDGSPALRGRRHGSNRQAALPA